MYKIDELITEIHANEAVEIPGELTKEQKKRVEAYLQTMILAETGAEASAKRMPYRKRTAALLVAVLVLMLGITVFAAKRNEWDITLINFMGLNNSDTLQLEGGEVIINETTTSTWEDYAQKEEGEEKEFSITEITSIGDKNSAYLRVNTDYELPDGFDEKKDYILPENHSMDITYNNIFGNKEIRTFASTFTAVYEEGKLGFLISIENCEDLNKCNVTLKIENLYWYHDLGEYEKNDTSEPEELLAAGTWETEWRYTYKSNVKTIHKMKQFDTKEGKIFLTKIEISPISVRMEAVRNPKDRELPWTMEMLEEIHYNDGTKIIIEDTATGGIGNGIFIDEFTNAYYLGEVIRPEEIACLVVCGKKVDL